MAARVPNIAKGRIGHYASLPASDDALIMVLVQAGADDLDDFVDDVSLAGILATNAECNFTGYARRTLTTVAWQVDNANDLARATADNPASWTRAGGSSQAAAYAVVGYDPDTTGGTDADIIPIGVYDCVVTFDDGVETTVQFHTDGVVVAGEPE